MAMRAAELMRILAEMGFECSTSTGGGSHFKIKRDGQRTVSISLHNGLKEEVSNFLLKKLARQLAIDPEKLGCT